MSKLHVLLLIGLSSASAVLAQKPPEAEGQPYLDVPYVPTSPAIMKAMLTLANVHKGDVLYDLGCGDGRIVIAAAKQYGARGTGVDIDPERIKEAREIAIKEGVSDKAKFRVEDLFATDMHDADVVTLYLLPIVNMKLRPTLRSLKPGTRIVSHAWDMGDWKPDKTISVEGRNVYLWVIPSNRGTISLWTNVAVPRGDSMQLPLTLSAPAPAGGVTVTLTSSDPQKAGVTSTVFVEEGATHPSEQPRLTGLDSGSVTITASAPGFTADAQLVQVTGQPASIEHNR